MAAETKDTKSRLTPLEWVEAETKWASGEYTLSKLEEEYGLRAETFSRYFRKRGIEKGADLVGKMVRESLKSDAEMRAKALADKIEERRNNYDTWATTLSRMVMGEVVTAKRSGRELSTAEENLRSLQRASNTLAKCYDISSKALGMDRLEVGEEEIPNLVFGELTPSQVAQLRKEDESNIEEDYLETLEEEAISGIEGYSDTSDDDEEDDSKASKEKEA